MLDLGWTELLVVGIVALIVVGRKDLPKMFRTLGQFMAKARAMAREFQRAMDDAADASGVKDVAQDLKKATNPQGMGFDELNKMKNWDPLRDDQDTTKAKGKAKGKEKPASEADDEAELDRVSAEMENLRRERAQAKASAAKAKAAKTEASGESPAPAAPGSAKDAPAEPPAQPATDASDTKKA